MHSSIDEGIVHAETNWACGGKEAEPSWGSTHFNDSVVAGWQLKHNKRYRLDYAHQFVEENRSTSSWSGTPNLKGTRGVHVNEENFDDPNIKG